MQSDDFSSLLSFLRDTDYNSYRKLRWVDFILIFCLEHIDSEYFTFILGFFSSFVIEDIHNFFDTTIQDDPCAFLVLVSNIALLALLCVLFLCFSIHFANLQKRISTHTTKIAKYHFILDHFVDFMKTIRLLSNILLGVVLLLLLIFGVNIFKFVSLNFVDSISPQV